MTEILKPCPFCGSQGVLCVSGNNSIKKDGKLEFVYRVRCMACGMGYAGGSALSVQEAIASWNRRIFMSDELKTCPFCGGNPELLGEQPIQRVRCTKCGMATLWSSDAVSVWNNRRKRPARLLPCPMCGKKAMLHKDHVGFYVSCSGCLVCTDDFRNAEAAREAWNRRMNS